MSTNSTPTKCHYCGRAIRKNQRPFVKRGFFENGTDYVGHKACYIDMMAPDYAQSRHDIPIGRNR